MVFGYRGEDDKMLMKVEDKGREYLLQKRNGC